MQGGGLLGGSWMSSWTAGWVAEPNNRRRSGGTGRRARVTVRRQTSGKALVWVSEPTDVGKSTGLGFSALLLTCVTLCTSAVPLGPPYRAGQFTVEAPSALTTCSFISLAPSQVLEPPSPLQHTCFHHPADPKARPRPAPGGPRLLCPPPHPSPH